MFQFIPADEVVNHLARQNTKTRMTDEQFIVAEINRFRRSKRFYDMIAGDNYYSGKHDILHKKRTAIGDNGELIEINNLPNNKIVDNQYRKMVNQKSNYLVGQPFTLQCENQLYVEALKPYIHTKKFLKMLKEVAKDSLNGGVSWMHPHYDEDGEFAIKRFKPYEIIPFWKDAEHTILDAAIRPYEVVAYEGTTEKIITKVEVFDTDGLYYFELTDGGSLVPEEPYYQPYFTVTDHEGISQGFNWDKIPLIPFKYNAEEVPLITMCKSSQDGLNKIESQWEDQMEEDPRNTIMVLVNYDGQNLGEFRRNLAQFGAVKVRSMDGANGDVKTLQIQVNAENYKAIIEQFKKAIIENCMGYDAKDDRLGGNANEMNIKSMYSDIELDTNGMETEFQAAFEDLLWFINCHLANTGAGDFEGEELTIIFNRDILISESEVIDNVNKSTDLSLETRLAQHPWVDDVEAEIKRINKEKEENMDLYGAGAFGVNNDDDDKGKNKDKGNSEGEPDDE
jgi:SPP1 family phage portal protein